MSKQGIYIALLAGIISMALVINLRFFSGEDSWICQDGKWVAHGQPEAPQPVNPCK